MLTKALRLN
jgi:hypothetical protein